MELVYLLHHVYELPDDFGTHEEVKFIGAYSSKEKAQRAIQLLKDKDGFSSLPVTCFEIDPCRMDQTGWENGFSTIRY